MGIAIKPVKLTRNEIEVDIDPSVPLRTGQILRLESDRPIYGRVLTIQTVDHGYRAVVHILYGEPHLGIHTAHLLDGTQLAAELQQLLGHVSEPLFLGDTFMGDLSKMGPLTVIDGDSLESRHQAAVEIMDGLRLHHRLLVIDPLGLFALAEGYHVAVAGQDVKLSLQEFGLSRFLSELSRMIPETFHQEALQLLGQGIPMTLDFLPCKSLLSPKRYEDKPAKGPLLHLLYDIHRQGVFADEPEEVFALDTAIPDQMNVLELSNLEDPWRSVFYAHVCETLVRHKVHDLIPVLIYPENYLEALDHWLGKLDEAEYRVLVLPSNAGRRLFEERAGNRFVAEHALGSDEVYVHLSGNMTLQLTATALLRGMEESEADLLGDLELMGPASQAAKPQPEEFAPFPEMGGPLPEEPEPEAFLEETEPEPEDEAPEMAAPEAFELAFEVPAEASEGEQSEEEPEEAELAVSYTPPPPPPPLAESRPVGGRGLQEIPTPEPLETLSEAYSEEMVEDMIPGEPLSERVEETYEAVTRLPGKSHAESWEPAELDTPPQLAFEEAVTDLDFDFDPRLDVIETPPAPEPPPRMQAPEPEPEPAPAETEQPASGHGLDDIYRAESEPDFEFEFEPDYEPVSPVASEVIETDQPVPGPTGQESSPEPAPRPEAAPPPMPPMPGADDGLSEIPVYQTVDPQSQAVAEQAGYHPGDRVRHNKYGDGVVEKVIPMEERVTLKIIFESIGKRLLDAESAHLQKA